MGADKGGVMDCYNFAWIDGLYEYPKGRPPSGRLAFEWGPGVEVVLYRVCEADKHFGLWQADLNEWVPVQMKLLDRGMQCRIYFR